MPFAGLKSKADATTPAHAGVRGKQFHAVKMTDDYEVDEITSAADEPLGILIDNPQLAGDGATVSDAADPQMKARAGGACTAGHFLKHDATGRLVNAASPAAVNIDTEAAATAHVTTTVEWVMAIAMQNAVEDDLFMVKPITPQPRFILAGADA